MSRGQKSLVGISFHPVRGGVSDRYPPPWPLLESNRRGRATLAAARWVRSWAISWEKAVGARSAAGEPGIYRASSQKLRVICGTVAGRT